MTQTTDSASLPRPAPTTNPETQPFWDATTRGKLVLVRCNHCGTIIWYPRRICPQCHNMDTTWSEASGHGTIYSFAIVRRGQGKYRNATPYVLAYVELAEGPKIMTNIVNCDTEQLTIGQSVQVVFHDTGGGAALPRFEPENS